MSAESNGEARTRPACFVRSAVRGQGHRVLAPGPQWVPPAPTHRSCYSRMGIGLELVLPYSLAGPANPGVRVVTLSILLSGSKLKKKKKRNQNHMFSTVSGFQ